MRFLSFSAVARRIAKFAAAHKFLVVLGALGLALAAWGGVRSFQANNQGTRYVLAKVQKTTIVTSVSGSGQVSATSQVDVKAKASGEIIQIVAQEGTYVGQGAVLARIDATNAQKAVRDATIALENQRLTLEKLAGSDAASVPRNKQDAIDALERAYADGFSSTANAFLDFPSIMAGMQQIVLGYTLNASQWNIDWYANAVQRYTSAGQQYRDQAYESFQRARASYDAAFAQYKATDRDAATSSVDALLNSTYAAAQDIAEAVKAMTNLVQFYEDTLNQYGFKPNALADTQLATLNSYTSKANAQLATLRSAVNTIKTDVTAVADADLELKAAQLNLQQRENALRDAEQNLEDYTVRAPFAGLVADVSANVGDSAGSGTTIATMISQQKLATISLNEVDAAKIKTGQKTTLTFDAIDGLTIAGEVTQVDAIGAVSQGVVTYGVTIQFDTQDPRVKSGMSVNAAIVTEVKQNVLAVPNAAVRAQGSVSYVEILRTIPNQAGNQTSATVVTREQPIQQEVQVGAANDTDIEILSGLSEGQWVIARSALSSARPAQTSQAPSLFGGGGGGARGAGH